MSDEITLARPYAEAIFAYANEKDELPAWLEQLDFWAQIVQDPQAQALLKHPHLSAEQKMAFLSHESMQPAQQNLLRLLLENDRLTVLPQIAQQVKQLRDQQAGLVRVEIISAFDIDAEQQQALATAIQNKLGHEIAIQTAIDPSLIGGIKIRAGDLVIDGSIAGQINRLANELGIG